MSDSFVAELEGAALGRWGSELDAGEVGAVCERVLAGGEATRGELERMMCIRAGSEQASVLADAAEVLARRGNGGRGYIYGQIGIDAGPCPCGCLFCSFASCNATAPKDAHLAAPIADVVHYAHLFAENGVHLVSVMSSAAYGFERYRDVVMQVREAIGPDVQLMANTGDLTVEQCRALRAAGADSLYHAVRLGEGKITALDPRIRRETLAAAREAGLAVSTAVEPLYISLPHSTAFQQNPADIVERMLEVVACEPFCSGVSSLHAVAGTKMEGARLWSRAQMRVFGDVFQLAARGRISHGGAGSVLWVDAGLDPRGRGYSSSDDRLRLRISDARKQLVEAGWLVP